jgi:hypothetical protein
VHLFCFHFKNLVRYYPPFHYVLSMKYIDVTEISPVHGRGCDVQVFPIFCLLLNSPRPPSPRLYLEYASSKGVQLVTVITSNVSAKTELVGNRNNLLDLSRVAGCQTVLSDRSVRLFSTASEQRHGESRFLRMW